MKTETGFSTKAIHAGQKPAPENNAIMTPVYLSSTFVQESPGVHKGYEYSRTGNPTRTALEANLAALEQGKHGVCFGSGCAASSALMHLLKQGDHVVSCDDVYGGTYRLFETIFKPLGLDFSFVNMTDISLLESSIKPNTKLIWVETPTNPLLKIIDIERVVGIAHKQNIAVVVDNTFASPYLQNPLTLGADIVLHSCTKYIGGHSDTIGGVLLTNSDEYASKLHTIQNSVGAIPSPFDCFMLLRSTKTLALRMERHCENAEKIADFLMSRNDVSKVIYPGLENHPQHELCKKQMRAGGGMITLVLDGEMNRARRFLETVSLFSLAESLGGVESLIEHPAIMTHAALPKDVRESLGIVDGLVRLSVGVEDVDDLISDLNEALDA